MPLEQTILDALADDPDTLAAVQALEAEIAELKAATSFDAEVYTIMSEITIALIGTTGPARSTMIADLRAAVGGQANA